MIPQAQSASIQPIQLQVFMPPSPRDAEVFDEQGLYYQAQNVARYFVRKLQRTRDLAFLDECEAEAWFVLVELYWQHYESICEKHPDITERHRFVRMAIGNRLKTYWLRQPRSTYHMLRSKGIDIKTVTLPYDLPSNENTIEYYLSRESVIQNEQQHSIVEFYLMGNSLALIAKKCNTTAYKVKRILRQIKKRLQHDNRRDSNATSSS